MRISIIVAAAQNGVIGKDEQLPWHLPDDLKRFKNLTMGHTLIMGRKTFESLPPKVRPLPGRYTVVLTRDGSYVSGGIVHVEHDLSSALQLAEDIEDQVEAQYVEEGRAHSGCEVFICGGGEVYREALPLVDRVYLTVVERDFEGDTRFEFMPLNRGGTVVRFSIGSSWWQLVNSERGEGELPHRFEIWDRAR